VVVVDWHSFHPSRRGGSVHRIEHGAPLLLGDLSDLITPVVSAGVVTGSELKIYGASDANLGVAQDV